MARITKNQVFWVLWIVVMAAVGGAYYFLVLPKTTDFRALADKQKQMAARMWKKKEKTEFKPITDKIVAAARNKPWGKKPPAGEGAEKLMPWTDALIWSYYPLDQNLGDIPGKGAGAPEGRMAKDRAVQERRKLLGEEREVFVKELFANQNFMASVKEFTPPPPDHRDSFCVEWLMDPKSGQDAKIDQEFEELMGGRKCLMIYPATPVPGGSPQWLPDGRCSGYVNEADRPLVYRRLVLRRLILRAVARANAAALVPKGETYSVPDEKPRRVEGVTEIKWLSHAEYISLREGRFVSNAITAPVKEPLPYQITGVELRVVCHLAVVPALLGELESIGQVEKRPFTFWAEGMSIERVRGKPDWKPKEKRAENLAPDFGDRYLEWPVEVLIRGVVPQFDVKKLSEEENLAGA